MKQILYILALSLCVISCSKEPAVNSSFSNTVGTGGSLARFTIVNNYLYTVDGNSLRVFDITNPNAPVYKNRIGVGIDIEAIFPHKGNLFIASNTAMYIYSIANPELPVRQSHVQHLTGCDPIVANDSVAYLTIHAGNRCNGGLNQLQVYDVRNITYPVFIKSYNLSSPLGLSMHKNHLYVCDRSEGIKVFDISNPWNPTLQQIITGENYLDIISFDNLASQSYMICMLTDGVAYYDITNPSNIQKLATVK